MCRKILHYIIDFFASCLLPIDFIYFHVIDDPYVTNISLHRDLKKSLNVKIKIN
jgi:hypothetical protein